MTILADLQHHQLLFLKILVVVGAFVLMTIVFLALTRLILRWISHLTHTHREWMEALVQALSPALKLGAILIALVIALSLEPIPSRWHGVIGAIISAGTVLALVVFVDGLLTFWMARAAVRFPLLDQGYGIVTGLVRGMVFGLGVLMFLDSIGISIGPILATLGVGSLAIALALQETLKNTLSGFFVVIDKPLEVGDYVKLSTGQEGWLTQLGWRSSKFRMMNDNIVVVPNSQLVDSILTNLRGPQGALTIEVDLTVAAGPELHKIEEVTHQAAAEAMKFTNDGADAGLEPAVYFQSISGASLGVAVLLRVARSSDIEQVRHDFVKRVSELYKHQEIKLA
jgi:small-conductance mechanosensitive channel